MSAVVTINNILFSDSHSWMMLVPAVLRLYDLEMIVVDRLFDFNNLGGNMAQCLERKVGRQENTKASV